MRRLILLGAIVFACAGSAAASNAKEPKGWRSRDCGSRSYSIILWAGWRPAIPRLGITYLPQIVAEVYLRGDFSPAGLRGTLPMSYPAWYVKACKEIGSPWVAPRIAHQVILHNAARVDCTFPVRPLLDIGGSPGFWNILVTLQTARGTHIPVVEVGWPYIGFDKRFCRKLPLPS